MELLRGALQPRHKAAARMRIEGRNNKEICAELGIKPKTLHEWMCDDKIREYMRTLSEHVEREFASRLAESGMKGLTAIMDLLDRPLVAEDSKQTAEDQLRLAQELLDRHPAFMHNRERVRLVEAKATNEAENATKLVQIFANLDDASLLQFVSDAGNPAQPQLPPSD